MIIITGAAGFIASNLVSFLNHKGFKDLILSDDFSREDKFPNYQSKEYSKLVPRDELTEFVEKEQRFIQFVVHLGARTDTSEFDKEVFNRLNLGYTKKLWALCVKHGIPMIYASSAATYGDGTQGYSDNHEVVSSLKPLNPYGESKNEFDQWALAQNDKPYFWAGLKFFNVYGPNEYHKGRMASVVYHAYKQIKESGKMKLFRSHRDDVDHGEQSRDFIYVEDVCEVIYRFMLLRKKSGIYNLGTGNARSFNDLVRACFTAMRKEPKIEYIDTPIDIRDKYQYYTQAEMQKLFGVFPDICFKSLEEGVGKYVEMYLEKDFTIA